MSAAAAVASATTAGGGGGKNSLRQRLLRGGKSYGVFCMSDSPLVAEMLSVMGYDHVVIDHEHGPTNIRSGLSMLQAVRSGQAAVLLQQQQQQQQQGGGGRDATRTTTTRTKTLTEAIVRLPSADDPVYMKKVLDTLPLPAGVLVPMVEDAATARAVVASTRYPKQQQKGGSTEEDADSGGIRGCAAPMVRGSAWGLNTPRYMQQCQRDLLVMVQVETPKGVEAIPEIAAVPGVDAIFLGPLDLSCSVGKMGQFHDPAVKALIAKAEAAVVYHGREHRCVLAGFKPAGRDLKSMFDAGYGLVSGSADMALLHRAALDDVEQANKVLKAFTSKE